MRPPVPLGCSLALVLAGCAGADRKPADQIRTTSEANRESLGGAIVSPLRDVNLLRTKIPPVLLDAMADPYQRPPPGCASLAREVALLDVALGHDIDVKPVKENEDLIDRGRRSVGPMAIGAVSDFARDAIPFRGWIRRLTGAEAHDRLVTGAMTAGAIRRSYLKGLGEARDCGPAAQPVHLVKPGEAPPAPPPVATPVVDLAPRLDIPPPVTAEPLDVPPPVAPEPLAIPVLAPAAPAAQTFATPAAAVEAAPPPLPAPTPVSLPPN